MVSLFHKFFLRSFSKYKQNEKIFQFPELLLPTLTGCPSAYSHMPYGAAYNSYFLHGGFHFPLQVSHWSSLTPHSHGGD